MKPMAWYDPTNGAVSTDKNSPLFTQLGQVWPLYREREFKAEKLSERERHKLEMVAVIQTIATHANALATLANNLNRQHGE